MDNNLRFKIFGYMDLWNSAVDIVVSTMTNGMSIYYIVTKDKYDGIFLTFLWPALNVIITMLLILANVGQTKNSRNLIWAGKEDVGGAEMERLKDIWTWKNLATCFVAVVWFSCFGILVSLQHGWNIGVILGFFLETALSRGLVTLGMYKIKFVEELDYPNMAQDLQEDYIEMQEQNPDLWRAPMRKSDSI